MPKLSIITVNLNNREGLERTIQSVINQTFTDFEYIIIDGGSTDGSVELIQSFNPSILQSFNPSIPQSFTWISEPDTGIYNAMNKGIKLAKGEYLQFLNSGDWLYSNTVLEEVFALNRTEDILYGSDILYFNNNKTIIKEYPQQITLYYLLNGTLPHQATFHNRILFDQPYDESYKIVADWEFYIRKIIFSNCSTYNLNKIIAYFDMSGISQVDMFSNLKKSETQNVLNKYFPERILLDYAELRQLKFSRSSLLYKNIEFIIQYPSLLKFIRRTIRITVVIYCFFYHITPPKK